MPARRISKVRDPLDDLDFSARKETEPDAPAASFVIHETRRLRADTAKQPGGPGIMRTTESGHDIVWTHLVGPAVAGRPG